MVSEIRLWKIGNGCYRAAAGHIDNNNEWMPLAWDTLAFSLPADAIANMHSRTHIDCKTWPVRDIGEMAGT